MRILAFVLLALAPGAVLAQAAPGAPRQITVDEAVRLALRGNSDMRAADAELDAATAARASARGGFGPRVRLEGNVIRWSEPLETTFAPPGAPPSPPIVIRDDLTWGATVSVIQPLTPLWSIYEGYRVRDLGVDVASVRREAARRDTAFQTTEAFYRLLQSMRLSEVAATSVAELEAQVQRAESFHRAGLVGRNDVLRAELGLAAARQRLIQTRGAITLARGRLAMLVGLPADTVLEPVGAPTTAPPPDGRSVEAAEARALARRAEIREIDARIAQARAGSRAAWSKMLPQVNAIASYQHSEGSAFQQEDAAYVGAFLTWDVWEWGSGYYGTEEAGAQLEQAMAGRAKVADGVRLDARAAWVGQASAAQALDVATRAVAQAEENLRIEWRRYEANANTTFDVLDAEGLYTQARAQRETALYDYLVARAALRRATGEEPAGAR